MSGKWSGFQKWTIGLTIVAIIVGALVTVLFPEVRVWLGLEKRSSFMVTGTVVDGRTDEGISGAEISVVGRAEHCRSEDNGNFRMQISEVASESPEPIRLRATKESYQPLDVSVALPSTGTILALRKISQ
jgi:hypothetical protein